MKVKLKNFPNGATVVYLGMLFTKKPCPMPYHFALVNEKYELYLHRETFVEPMQNLPDVKAD